MVHGYIPRAKNRAWYVTGGQIFAEELKLKGCFTCGGSSNIPVLSAPVLKFGRARHPWGLGEASQGRGRIENEEISGACADTEEPKF